MLDQVDSLILVYLRALVAVAVYFWLSDLLAGDRYHAIFIEPRFLFKYAGLEWVRLWPAEGIYWHLVALKIISIALLIGLLTRISASILFVSIAYLLVVQRQIHTDYGFLLLSLCGLLIFLPAGRRLSVDTGIGLAKVQQRFWRWQWWLLRFQLGIPYLVAALAMLSGDWLRGQPVDLLLRSRLDLPLVAWLASIPAAAAMIAAAGFICALLVVPMLLCRPTRWIGVFLIVCFYWIGLLFSAGTLPWFMLAALPLFFPPQTLPRRMRLFLGQQTAGSTNPEPTALAAGKEPTALAAGREPTALAAGVNRGANQPSTPEASTYDSVKKTDPSRAAIVGAVLYIVIQTLFPLRGWLYPGNADWNERGRCFAWRAMLSQKRALTHFLLIDESRKEYIFVPSTIILTPSQASAADHHPELVRQTSVQLKELVARELGVADCRVHALALVSLNARRPKPIVDPEVDLPNVKRRWWRDDWVTDGPGPFLHPPWTTAREEWWKELQLPGQFQALQGRTPSQLQQFLDERKRLIEQSRALSPPP